MHNVFITFCSVKYWSKTWIFELRFYLKRYNDFVKRYNVFWKRYNVLTNVVTFVIWNPHLKSCVLMFWQRIKRYNVLRNRYNVCDCFWVLIKFYFKTLQRFTNVFVTFVPVSTASNLLYQASDFYNLYLDKVFMISSVQAFHNAIPFNLNLHIFQY